MKEIPEIIPAFLEPLAALQRLSVRFNGRGVIIGGIAASLLGKPRLTYDIDALFLISIEEINNLVIAAREEGIETRIEDAEVFARKHRVLLLRHSRSNINIDISLGILPFEEELVEKSSLHQVASISIRLPITEDLIIMKAVAHRQQDLQDIQALVEIHPELDQKRIEYWVRQFADAFEMPELWKEIGNLIKSRLRGVEQIP